MEGFFPQPEEESSESDNNVYIHYLSTYYETEHVLAHNTQFQPTSSPKTILIQNVAMLFTYRTKCSTFIIAEKASALHVDKRHEICID